MSTTDERALRTLRTMAWERAKGELRSMAQTYWQSSDDFDRFNQEVEAFIAHIEDEGIHE